MSVSSALSQKGGLEMALGTDSLDLRLESGSYILANSIPVAVRCSQALVAWIAWLFATIFVVWMASRLGLSDFPVVYTAIAYVLLACHSLIIASAAAPLWFWLGRLTAHRLGIDVPKRKIHKASRGYMVFMCGWTLLMMTAYAAMVIPWAMKNESASSVAATLITTSWTTTAAWICTETFSGLMQWRKLRRQAQ
jgi:hypothetical protein